MLGLFKRPKMEAKFKLCDGPVVILVDDFQEHCYWSEITSVLAEKTTNAIQEHGAAKTIISPIKIRRLRQTTTDYDELGAREVGRLVQAEQLVWLQVVAFDATEDPHEIHAAATLSVTVKVINALEEQDRSKVRLWPSARDGERTDVEIGAAGVAKAKNRAGIVDALCEKMGQKVARHFYDRLMDDFEEE